MQGLPLWRRWGLRKRSLLDDLNQRKGNKTWVICWYLIKIFLESSTLLKTLNSKDLTSKLLCLPNLLTLLIQYVIMSPKHGPLLRIQKKKTNQPGFKPKLNMVWLLYGHNMINEAKLISEHAKIQKHGVLVEPPSAVLGSEPSNYIPLEWLPFVTLVLLTSVGLNFKSSW